MKRFLRHLAELPWRIMPASLRIALLKAGVFASARRPARDALLELLEFDRVVSGQIDLAAMEYDGGVHAKHRLMAYHDFFVDRIGRTDRVLDIGCGYGAVANSIADRAGASVTAMDMDAGNIAKAQRQFPKSNLTFVHGEAPRDLGVEHFDVVVLSNVLEHIDARVDFLMALREKVSPDRVLIRVPMSDRDWRVPLRAELGLFHFSDPTHFTEYTRTSFEHEMAAAGLSIVHLQVNWGEIWAEVRPAA